ncbi:MAG: hypothetical protein P9X22_04205 [Candidatus Zapsychrus exili]|nr:hypothetical protein [Candidatus Zapsychrus exili]
MEDKSDKKNCWEFKKCGREPGGDKTESLGVCPAASEESVEGINNGKNAGRCCWVVAGTFCGGEKQGIFSKKLFNCIKCEFYEYVQEQEDSKFSFLNEALKKLGREQSNEAEQDKGKDI